MKLKKKKKQELYSGIHNNILDKPYNKQSLQHQFYRTLYKNRDILKINFDNIKIFSVVRNPYNRIISDMLWWGKYRDKNNIFEKNPLPRIKKDFTPEQVYDIIVNSYINRTDLDNHNEPQYKFLCDDNMNLIPSIKIFKCETLNETNDEINEFIRQNINIKRKNVNKNYLSFLNDKSINIINEKYKRDFELFGYEMIIPEKH